jgi:hypothetical protein
VTYHRPCRRLSCQFPRAWSSRQHGTESEEARHSEATVCAVRTDRGSDLDRQHYTVKHLREQDSEAEAQDSEGIVRAGDESENGNMCSVKGCRGVGEGDISKHGCG